MEEPLLDDLIELHYELVKLEEITRAKLKTIRDMKRSLRNATRMVKATSSERAKYRSKIFASKSSKVQREFNAMSFEERLKFIEEYGY